MKKLLALLLVVYVISAFTTPVYASGDKHEIPMHKDGGEAMNHSGKNQEKAPFDVYYMDDIGGLCVTFNQNVGDVCIDVENCFSGESSEWIVNASEGAVFLLIGNDEGYYSVTVGLSDCTEYVGEFEIFNR